MGTRLERLENKIDDLQEAVISLARVEERITTIFNRQTTIEQRVNDMDDKIQSISPAVRFAERIFWVAVVVGISVYFKVG